MLTVAFHREGDARDEGQRRGAGMIEAAGFEILGQLVGGVEVLSVGAVVVDVLQHLYRLLERLVAPALRRGNMPEESQAIAVVLTALVVEVLLKGDHLLLAEVMVFHEVVTPEGLGIHGNASAGYTLDLCLLLWREEKAAGIDHHGIIALEAFHLLGLDAVYLNLRVVVAQHDVCLL